MGMCLIGDAAFMQALKDEALWWVLEVPARHKTQEEYTRSLEYALARGWGSPMRNHAGRWFTCQGEREGMCRVTSGIDKRHRCKDMEPDPAPRKPKQRRKAKK